MCWEDFTPIRTETCRLGKASQIYLLHLLVVSKAGVKKYLRRLYLSI